MEDRGKMKVEVHQYSPAPPHAGHTHTDSRVHGTPLVAFSGTARHGAWVVHARRLRGSLVSLGRPLGSILEQEWASGWGEGGWRREGWRLDKGE